MCSCAQCLAGPGQLSSLSPCQTVVLQVSNTIHAQSLGPPFHGYVWVKTVASSNTSSCFTSTRPTTSITTLMRTVGREVRVAVLSGPVAMVVQCAICRSCTQCVPHVHAAACALRAPVRVCFCCGCGAPSHYPVLLHAAVLLMSTFISLLAWHAGPPMNTIKKCESPRFPPT